MKCEFEEVTVQIWQEFRVPYSPQEVSSSAVVFGKDFDTNTDSEISFVCSLYQLSRSMIAVCQIFPVRDANIPIKVGETGMDLHRITGDSCFFKAI